MVGRGFSGERDFSGLHKKMVGIPLEVENKSLRSRSFRETERLFFNLLGKEIHLFLSKQKRRKGMLRLLILHIKKRGKDENFLYQRFRLMSQECSPFCYMLALNHYGIQHNGKTFTTILFIDKALMVCRGGYGKD